MDSKTLIRKDEAIYFLVYSIRSFEDDKLREKIYASFPTLLSNPEDLFLFIHLYVNFDKDKKHGMLEHCDLIKMLNYYFKLCLKVYLGALDLLLLNGTAVNQLKN